LGDLETGQPEQLVEGSKLSGRDVPGPHAVEHGGSAAQVLPLAIEACGELVADGGCGDRAHRLDGDRAPSLVPSPAGSPNVTQEVKSELSQQIFLALLLDPWVLRCGCAGERAGQSRHRALPVVHRVVSTVRSNWRSGRPALRIPDGTPPSSGNGAQAAQFATAATADLQEPTTATGAAIEPTET
jgi:hypothetical protein